jgi:hypothetical protein
MKQNYIKPEAIVEELAVETMLATSDRIPLDKEPGTPAANGRRGEWGNLWADGIDE